MTNKNKKTKLQLRGERKSLEGQLKQLEKKLSELVNRQVPPEVTETQKSINSIIVRISDIDVELEPSIDDIPKKSLTILSSKF